MCGFNSLLPTPVSKGSLVWLQTTYVCLLFHYVRSFRLTLSFIDVFESETVPAQGPVRLGLPSGDLTLCWVLGHTALTADRDHAAPPSEHFFLFRRGAVVVLLAPDEIPDCADHSASKKHG